MRLLILILMLLNLDVFSANLTVKEIRVLYKKSTTDASTCKKLISSLKTYNESNNSTFTAYKACATMIMAKHVINPISKLDYFNEGKNLLEKCIYTDKDNIEIRFLRFTIQSNSPSFLNYNASISNDKFFLLKSIENVKDIELKQLIISFLKSSKYLTDKEKKSIKP